MSIEKDKLEDVAVRSIYTAKTGVFMQKYTFEIIKRFFLRDLKCLELGPAEGIMTDELVEYFDSLDVVEGSSNFANKIKYNYPEVNCYNCLFEDFNADKKYDLIILSHVLEHVEDPVFILNKVKNWLAPNGKVFAAVPNAKSIHRQAAVYMDLLNSIYDQSEKDVYHGHRRVFDSEQFKACFLEAGFNILEFGGYWLKPLSDQQIESSWTDQMLSAFMKLGEDYPELAAENYLVAGSSI